jgi:large subunit ribosomal protein L23
MRTTSEVLIRPVISEKSYAEMQLNKYTFRVHRSAEKIEIKRAIEDAFGVKVVDVNTINVIGKERRLRRERPGHTPGWKKAVVTIAAGQKIEKLFEGV